MDDAGRADVHLRAERATVPTLTGVLRRLAVLGTAAVAYALAAATTGQPVANAADGRDQLANAINATKGTYLVYNFGGGHPAPMLNAAGRWYEMGNGGHLMIIKNASARLAPHLLVDTHRGVQARCEHKPGARTHEGLWQASELYTPLNAWQRMGQPTIAVNANFFDVRPQLSGSWRHTGCSSPLGAFVDNTHGQGRANQSVTGTAVYPGKQGLSGGGEAWSALTTMIMPTGGAPYVVWPKSKQDYDAATPVVADLLDKNARFVAVSGIGLLAPGNTGQLNDGGPSAARTALAYARQKDEMYVFEGGSYTPDNMQDLFRGLGSESAVLLDGGGSSAIVLRRDTGGMWAGAGSPRGSCDTRQVLCDSHERALPSWLAFN
ncbi:phosphodiester glycosidase family protein [Mycobacterium sp. Lab-001]|uniref:phosphodiester glycosidase family protein n=1 Tax=Mycobacterium sp. Lab-001 TaxID=3410136 RepID=UPI003D179DC4